MTHKHKPSTEQQAIIDYCKTGQPLIIEAGAGAAKTTTLEMVAQDLSNKKGLYLSFNKSIADEASRRFPSNVLCKTGHSVAFQTVGKYFSHRLTMSRHSYTDAGRVLGISEGITLPSGMSLSLASLVRLATESVRMFCYSAEETISPEHLPHNDALEGDDREFLKQHLYPAMVRAWDDLSSPHGVLKYNHDCYYKLWSLQKPILDYDFIMIDEYQDTNACLEEVVKLQKNQVIVVGDSCQSIFAWRGAQNALARATGYRLSLTHSYRFGQEIADAANLFLKQLPDTLRLVGAGAAGSLSDLSSRVPKAILCRTNGRVFSEAATLVRDGYTVGISGGTEALRALAYAAGKLKQGQPNNHPDLFIFKTWQDLEAFVESEPRSELKPFVQIINRYGSQGVIKLLDCMVDEEQAEVVVSTAHKAKGKEWDSVRISNDFMEQGQDFKDVNELMLDYVAVTRAKRELDCSSLDWIYEMNGVEKEVVK